MSRFTRYRAQARKKKEQAQKCIDNFYNNAIKKLQDLEGIIKEVGEDTWNNLSDEERINLWKSIQ